MSKKRNKYFEKEKNFLRLQSELSKNWKAQRDLGYVELETPIRHGYTVRYVLRKDIANREDAWIFQYIIDNFTGTLWWGKNYLKHKSKKLIHDPEIYQISERKYNSLPTQVKKWYYEGKSIGIFKWYSCAMPKFFLELKVDKHYRTHVKVIDEILLQEEAELEAQFYSSKYACLRREMDGPPKHYVRNFNVKHKRRSKLITKSILTLVDIDDHEEYPITGRHQATYWWN